MLFGRNGQNSFWRSSRGPKLISPPAWNISDISPHDPPKRTQCGIISLCSSTSPLGCTRGNRTGEGRGMTLWESRRDCEGYYTSRSGFNGPRSDREEIEKCRFPVCPRSSRTNTVTSPSPAQIATTYLRYSCFKMLQRQECCIRKTKLQLTARTMPAPTHRQRRRNSMSGFAEGNVK